MLTHAKYFKYTIHIKIVMKLTNLKNIDKLHGTSRYSKFEIYTKHIKNIYLEHKTICMINEIKFFYKSKNQNLQMNEKMNNEKIMSYKIMTLICFEHTIIQKDSEKIFLTTKDIFQNIFRKMKDFVEFSKYRKNSD